MSQFYVNSSGSSPPPSVPTQFTAIDLTVATPAANNINLFTGQVSTNVDAGISDTAAGSTVTTNLTNRKTGNAIQVGAGPDTLITMPFVTDGTYYVWGNIQGYSINLDPGGVTKGGICMSYSGGFRMDSGVLVELGVEYHDTFQEAAISDADIILTTDGAANVLLKVIGIAGKTINWNALMEYRQVT